MTKSDFLGDSPTLCTQDENVCFDHAIYKGYHKGYEYIGLYMGHAHHERPEEPDVGGDGCKKLLETMYRKH